MRKIFSCIAHSVVIVSALIRCGDASNELAANAETPTISVEATIVNGPNLANGGDVVATDTVDFTLSVNSPGGFSQILIGGGANAFISRNDVAINDNNIQQVDGIPYRVFTNEADGGAFATFYFVAVDNIGQLSDSAIFNFNIISLVDEHDAVLLAGLQNATGSNFYDAIEDERFDFSSASSNSDRIDFFFYYDDDSDYTLASLDNGSAEVIVTEQTAGDFTSFPVRNPTRFKTFSSVVNFDDVRSVVDLENEFANPGTSGLSIVSELEEGDIIGFVLGDDRTSRIGLIRISSIDGDLPTNRTMLFDVKIEVD